MTYRQENKLSHMHGNTSQAQTMLMEVHILKDWSVGLFFKGAVDFFSFQYVELYVYRLEFNFQELCTSLLEDTLLFLMLLLISCPFEKL